MFTNNCDHQGLAPAVVIVTETDSIFLSHLTNALACPDCGKIIAIEVYEYGNLVMKMIETAKKQTAAG